MLHFLKRGYVCSLYHHKALSEAYAVFLIQQGRFGRFVACHTLAARSGVPLMLTEKSNVKWSTRASKRRYRTDVHRNVDFLFGPYLWRCHPPVKWVTEEGRIKREGGGDEWKETTGRKRKSSAVGRTKWKKCWQAGCSMAGKWDSHTAVFWRRGTPKIGVTVFHCQGEERERNTRDVVMYRERQRERGEGLGWGRKKIKVKRETDPGAAAPILPDGVEKREEKRTSCWRSGAGKQRNRCLVQLQGDLASAPCHLDGERGKQHFPWFSCHCVRRCWHL